MEQQVIAQIFGIFGMVMNVMSFQRKDQKSIIFMQLIGASFFAVNYVLLGAVAGAALNILGMVRATVYWKRDVFKTDKIAWVFGFSVAYIAVYILSFTVFGTEPSSKNLIVELLPVIGMILTTFSFYLEKAKLLRFLGIFNAPLWLTYNIINFTIGGIITEAVSLVSIIIGIIRYDLKSDEINEDDKTDM